MMNGKNFVEACEKVIRSKRPVVVAGPKVASGLLCWMCAELAKETGRYVEPRRTDLLPEEDAVYVMDAEEQIMPEFDSLTHSEV